MKHLLILMTLFVSIVASNPAKAIVGIAADDRTTALIGLALMDISQVVVVERRHRRYRRGWSSVTYTTVRVITFPALLLAGFVILDDEGKADVAANLTEEQIVEAGLTPDEVDAYTAENEELNAVLDTVTSEISELNGSKEQRAELASKLWADYAEALSPAAISAAHKLLN